MTTGVTAGEIDSQNNIASIGNIEGEYFSHFDTIGANLFGEGFEVFGKNNNNNPSPLSPPGFKGGLGKSFNLSLGGNAKELDPNVAALVNALTGANLGINQKSNHVKLTEFRKTEAEDSNE